MIFQISTIKRIKWEIIYEKILLILIAAFVLQFFVFGEEDSYEETFEQNETADMKDSFSQDDVLGLDGIFWEKPKSQVSLGSMYLYGEGVEQDYSSVNLQ